MEFEIIYTYDSERDEFEALNKGYRTYVIVQIKEERYELNFISMIRLVQDYEVEQEYLGYYLPEPNTLVVEDVTKETIEKVVKKLYERKYFEKE
ncbi:MAG: hypothetical protein HFH23_15620 [Ruminococcus sp.]|nr:hypothetical protein [Ruminococcus sp.]